MVIGIRLGTYEMVLSLPEASTKEEAIYKVTFPESLADSVVIVGKLSTPEEAWGKLARKRRWMKTAVVAQLAVGMTLTTLLMIQGGALDCSWHCASSSNCNRCLRDHLANKQRSL